MALTEAEKKHEKREKPATKVVVRRLPPSMDRETFLNQVSPIPDYNFLYHVKGDASLGEHSFSRFYINFLHPEDVYSFKERFDNYVFVDSKGHEYPAVVEFAPYQKFPKKRGKGRIDPKCGTIESDPIYIEFVESLTKPKEQDEKPEYTLQLTSEEKNDVTTPLLEFIKNKRAQRMKIREVRREERKRREFDRKKDRYDDRRRPAEEKSSANVASKAQTKNEEKTDETSEHKEEKNEKSYEKTYYKSREKRYDDRKYEDRKFDDRRKDKPRYPKKSYDNHDYKEKEYRPKYNDYKQEETITFTKKVKKYSEKREERRLEAQKAEQKKVESTSDTKNKETTKQSPKQASTKDCETVKADTAKGDSSAKPATEKSPKAELSVSTETKETSKSEKESPKSEGKTEKERHRETESQSQRRIRNKDRPTIAIYRPGMLSKRKSTSDGGEKSNETNSENKN